MREPRQWFWQFRLPAQFHAQAIQAVILGCLLLNNSILGIHAWGEAIEAGHTPTNTQTNTQDKIASAQSTEAFPELISMVINRQNTADLEVIKQPDGSILLPVKGLANALKFKLASTLNAKKVRLVDPKQNRFIEFDAENHYYKLIAGEQGTEQEYTGILYVQDDFLNPDELYVPQPILEKLLQFQAHYDHNNLLLTVTTSRTLDADAGDNNKLKQFSRDNQQTWLEKPPEEHAILEKISIDYQHDNAMFKTTLNGQDIQTNLANNWLNAKATGHAKGLDYFVNPKVTVLNGLSNVTRLDWGISKPIGENHTAYLGSMDAGLSSLVAPTLSLWGARVSTNSAKEPEVQTPQSYKLDKTRFADKNVRVELNGDVVQTYNKDTPNKPLTPVALKMNALNEITVIEEPLPTTPEDNLNIDNNAFNPEIDIANKASPEPLILDKITVPNFTGILPKGKMAYSAFLGRIPPAFYPVIANRSSTPMFLEQSNKWATGGRVLYGLNDRLTLQASGVSDHIFGRAKTDPAFFLVNQILVPNLLGNLSFPRDANFVNGHNIGLAANYQASPKLSFSAESALSYFNQHPGAPLTIQDNQIDKAIKAEARYGSENLTARVNAFHYGTHYYTPSAYTYENNLMYDRQGIEAGLNGSMLNTRYNLSGQLFQTNLDNIVSGGKINAHQYRLDLGRQIRKGLTLRGSYMEIDGSNTLNNYNQRNVTVAIDAMLPKNITATVGVNHFETSNSTLQGIFAASTSDDNKFTNTSIDANVNIPFGADHALAFEQKVSSLLNYSAIRYKFRIKNVILEPTVQLSYGGEQKYDRMGVRVAYEFKNGRRLGLGLYYNKSRFGALSGALDNPVIKNRQFFVEFSDVLSFLGKGVHSVGVENPGVGHILARSCVDLNKNATCEATEAIRTKLSYRVDNATTSVETNEDGELILQNITPGYHSIEPVMNTLPFSLTPDYYKLNVNVTADKTASVLLPYKLSIGSVSGQLNIRDVNGNRVTPSDDILITIVNKTTKEIVGYTSPDLTGAFRVENLEPGEYELDLEQSVKNSGAFKIQRVSEAFAIPIIFDGSTVDIDNQSMDLLRL